MNAGFFHQPGHPPDAAGQATPAELLMHPPGAIGPTEALVKLDNRAHQQLVVASVIALGTTAPGIVAAAGDAEQTA